MPIRDLGEELPCGNSALKVAFRKLESGGRPGHVTLDEPLVETNPVDALYWPRLITNEESHIGGC